MDFPQLAAALSGALAEIGDLVASGDAAAANHALSIARAIEEELCCDQDRGSRLHSDPWWPGWNA